MVGKNEKRLGKFAATHLNGAHHEVEVQDILNIVFNSSVILQQIHDGGIKVAFLTLREGNLLILIYTIVTGHFSDKAEEVCFGILQMGQQ